AFTARRHPATTGEMNRLYVIEATPSATGMYADHRLALPAHQVAAFAAALAEHLGGDLAKVRRRLRKQGAAVSKHAKWIAALAKDLATKGRPGKTLIIPGEHQPPAVHALAHLMNKALGNEGQTVRYIKPPEARPENQAKSLEKLVKA